MTKVVSSSPRTTTSYISKYGLFFKRFVMQDLSHVFLYCLCYYIESNFTKYRIPKMYLFSNWYFLEYFWSFSDTLLLTSNRFLIQLNRDILPPFSFFWLFALHNWHNRNWSALDLLQIGHNFSGWSLAFPEVPEIVPIFGVFSKDAIGGNYKRASPLWKIISDKKYLCCTVLAVLRLCRLISWLKNIHPGLLKDFHRSSNFQRHLKGLMLKEATQNC